MNELFGVSMTLIMWVLLGLLAFAVTSVIVVALTNRVMFKMGIRNIPRRPSQTVLIIIGLMLSTIIISAAFTTGDTVDRSITSQVYTLMGSLDAQLRPSSEEEDVFADPEAGAIRADSFEASSIQSLLRELDAEPLIDFVIPVYSDLAVAINTERRLSAPVFTVLGLDAARTQGLPDIEELNGRNLQVSELRSDEIYLNESGAKELALQAGDTVTLLVFGQPTQFRIKAVVRDRRLAGSGGISIQREGGVISLSAAQSLFKAEGQLTSIDVSYMGGERDSLQHDAAVQASIKNALAKTTSASAPQRLTVQNIKQTGVNIAEFGANLFTTFFLVLGLFSIGAGVLLIFMIFVMLAAERKAEMGMARAVGTKRLDLVQTFLAEGMAYNLLAAMVGAGLGILVAFLMAGLMASIFNESNIQIESYVTPRSVLISYSLGVVLTFFTVTFSSWRVSMINIVRAIRDIPEPSTPKPDWQMHGFFSTLRRLIFKDGGLKAWAKRLGLLVFGVGLIGIGGATGSTLVQVVLSVVGGLTLASFVFISFQTGPLFVIGSVPLILLGASSDSAFALLFGLSLLPLGLAFTLRSFGLNERLAYTLTGLLLIYIWEFDFSVGLIERIFGEANGDIEMFFLSGVMVTIAATFLVVYNADIVLAPLTRASHLLGALLPSIKMAVAYPLANRMRTGMTMAMFCLVVFALTVMSSMNFNFQRLFLSDRSLGGFDIVVDENPNNPINDLNASLRQANSPALAAIDSVGTAAVTIRRNGLACEVRAGATCNLPPAGAESDQTGRAGDFSSYQVWGDDAAFFSAASLSLQSRARGYANDAAVWRALAENAALAVVDVNALMSGGGGFGEGPFIRGIDPNESEFEPVTIIIADRRTGQKLTVQVIGVMELGPAVNFGAIHVSRRSFDSLFGEPDTRRLFVKTRDGADNTETAREIESALLTTGAQAESLRDRIDELTSTQTSFFYLMQGFMGLGLLVGVAAVGVIAFRTVVERRQQIGMLRALGYTRSMVGLTFLIESAFIAFMGVLSGVVFAVILARQLITDAFANQGGISFAVPWLQIGVIGGLAFGFALLMTLIPSRQASRIPIAEALRYE